MDERLLNILKKRSLSSGLIMCRDEGERIFLKKYLDKKNAVEPGVPPAAEVCDFQGCAKCPGVIERKRPFGSGINRVMIILNAPRLSGKMEIEFYRADSAALLKKMVAAIDLELNSCYVTNLIKCETSDSLVKPSDMVKNCLPVLRAEIERVKPLVILVMGEIVPLQPVVNACRGVSWFNTEHSISLIKNPDLKRSAWATLKLVKKRLMELRDES